MRVWSRFVQHVQRTPHPHPRLLEDVGVDHGGLDALVAKELLNGADVVAASEQVGGEGVPEGVAGDALPDPRASAGVADGALDG
jgi:hypothetical protein